MKISIKVIALAFVVLFASCNEEVKKTDNAVKETVKPLVAEVLTKEQQAALTPDSVIESFKEGNERFQNNDLTARDHSAQVRKTTHGQYPKAVVLSCIDSRVPVEDIFDKGIGDVFVARVAGNISDEDMLGSLEYSCKVAGSKVVLVLGHEHCGAVKSAVKDVKLGNITALLSKIRPVVESVEYAGDRTAKNKEFVHKVCEANVNNTIAQIRKNSPILKEMEDKGEIKIVGGIYDLDSGKVDFL